MNRRFHLVMISCPILVLISSLPAVADEWELLGPREFPSANGTFVLKVSPHEGESYRPGFCKAELFKVTPTGRHAVWMRYLINNNGPVRVFVADSGEYVVTMDEWHHVGDLPLVIYGRDGRLVRVHSVESLGLKKDISHIKRTVSSYWWNEDSISFFGPSEEYFFVRLHWEKMLLVMLADGDLADDEWYRTTKGWFISQDKWKSLRRFGERTVRELVSKMLKSSDPEDLNTAAKAAGQLKFRESIPKLRGLLKDAHFYESRSGDDPWMKVYYIRKAALDALANMGETPQGVITEVPRHP